MTKTSAPPPFIWLISATIVLLTLACGCGAQKQPTSQPPIPAVKLEMRLAEFAPREGLTPITQASGGPTVFMHKTVAFSNSDVVHAYPHQEHGTWCVTTKLTSTAASRMAQLTKSNINKAFAILLDGELVSAPTIKSEVSGGYALITGLKDEAEASRVATALSAP